MKHPVRFLTSLVLATILAASLGARGAFAADNRNKDDIALEASDNNEMQIRCKLFRARQRGDSKKIKELERKFRKALDDRERLLRKTWQM